MIFAAPWLLLALAVLPVLWWLLRVTPPAPRTENFPAIRLLLGLRAAEETAGAHAVVAAAAAAGRGGAADRRPGAARCSTPAAALPGTRPAAAGGRRRLGRGGDWAARLRAADAVLDRAERAGPPGRPAHHGR